MKKALAFKSLVLSLSLICGSAVAATQITYATWDGTREKADKALLAAFEKTNPDIKVKYTLIPWDVYWQKAAAMTAGGSTFDVMWMNLDNFAFYASQGAVAALPYSANVVGSIPKQMIAPYQVGDKTFGLPLGPQAVTVFVNRKLFKERGVPIPTTAWSYEQMLAAAKKLTFSKGGKKYWGINGQDLRPDYEYGQSFNYSNGGSSLVKKTATGYEANLDASFKDTTKKLWDLVNTHHVAPGVKDSTQQGYQLFQAGQMGIYIEGSWMVPVLNETKGLDWAYAPFPSMKAGLKPRPVYSAHSLVVPTGSKNKEAAQKLAEWMVNAPASQNMLAGLGLFPTLSEMFQKQYAAALPSRNTGTVFAQLKNSVIINSDLRINNLPEVLGALDEQISLLWSGNGTIDGVIQKAQENMNNFLKKSKDLVIR